VSQKLAKLLSQKQQGLPIQTAGTTLAVFLDEWLEDTVKHSVRPRTYDSYKSISKNHLIPSLGKHKLLDLTQQHVMAMMKAKREAGSSERNIAYMRVVLRIALNEAQRQDIVHRNVAELVRPPRIEEFDGQALDTDEAERFRKQVKDDRLAALYFVALEMGLRQSEILGLRWDDIDFERGSLAVRYQIRMVSESEANEIDTSFPRKRSPTKVSFVPTKSKGSRRTLAIPSEVLAMLKHHRKNQVKERLRAPKWNEYNLVFTSPTGNPVDAANLRKQFAAHLNAANLPRIRFHDLRHTASSLMQVAGVSDRTRGRILGHQTAAMTAHYTHVFDPEMQEAAERMSSLFSSNKQSS
jgi:integrase